MAGAVVRGTVDGDAEEIKEPQRIIVDDREVRRRRCPEAPILGRPKKVMEVRTKERLTHPLKVDRTREVDELIEDSLRESKGKINVATPGAEPRPPTIRARRVAPGGRLDLHEGVAIQRAIYQGANSTRI